MAKNSCNSLTTERKIEINGRVTLPKKIFEKMNLSVGDMVSISYNSDDDCIIILGVSPACALCGSHENLKEVENGKHICASCSEKIKGM